MEADRQRGLLLTHGQLDSCPSRSACPVHRMHHRTQRSSSHDARGPPPKHISSRISAVYIATWYLHGREREREGSGRTAPGGFCGRGREEEGGGAANTALVAPCCLLSSPLLAASSSASLLRSMRWFYSQHLLSSTALCCQDAAPHHLCRAHRELQGSANRSLLIRCAGLVAS